MYLYIKDKNVWFAINEMLIIKELTVFDADRPILKSSQDRLNRAIFSKYLARCILDHTDPSSTVLGLYGGWGTGKTSIINLMLEELNFASTNIEDNVKPIILNFSPWSYSGQNQLIYSFFRRLSFTLSNVTYLEKADRIIHLLELYISFFTHKPVPRPLRQSRTILERITFRNKEDVYGWEAGRDLTEVKAELNQLLSEQAHKIIIIIDNISRLYDDEIKQIFQIVKSIGDFSNTVYLLALDKDQVIYAMNRLNGRGGAEFVEKLVQLPFEIPEIDVQSLEAILIDRLSHMVQEVPQDAWQKDYWTDIYYSSFRNFFKNVRDITRYINTLHFSYLRLRDVVHPVDFFALTAIDVFLPEIYAAIRDNKDLFTDLISNVYLEDKAFLAKDKLRCDTILASNTRIPKHIVLDMLILLFPRLQKLYSPDKEFYYNSKLARKLKRVSDPDSFDAYFRLSIQEGQVQEDEFKTILNLARDQETFTQALARLNKDERIVTFLCQLDGHVLDNVSLQYAANMCAAFFDDADLFPKGASSALSFDTFSRIYRIINRLLIKFNKGERFNVLKGAIDQMQNSILLAIFVMRELSKEFTLMEEFAPDQDHSILSQDQINELKKAVCTKISAWAESGRLAEHPDRLSILYAWREWGNEKQCEEYVKKLIQTDPGLMSFLLAALQKPIADAMTEYKKKADWEQSLTHITYFIPVDLLKDRAIAIFEDGYFEKLREQEQLAIVIFLDLIHAETTKVIPKTTA